MSRAQLAKALELSKNNVPKHVNPLIPIASSSDAWECDGCSEHQPIHSERYNDNKLDFDYCRKCVEKSGTAVIGGLLPLKQNTSKLKYLQSNESAAPIMRILHLGRCKYRTVRKMPVCSMM